MLAIAVIPKGTTHIFWKSIEAGARRAAQELGVEISWKGSLNEDNCAQQISLVEQFAPEGKSGIVLAPIDDTALRLPVQSAMEKKPVVIVIRRSQVRWAKIFLDWTLDIWIPARLPFSRVFTCQSRSR